MEYQLARLRNLCIFPIVALLSILANPATAAIDTVIALEWCEFEAQGVCTNWPANTTTMGDGVKRRLVPSRWYSDTYRPSDGSSPFNYIWSYYDMDGDGTRNDYLIIADYGGYLIGQNDRSSVGGSAPPDQWNSTFNSAWSRMWPTNFSANDILVNMIYSLRQYYFQITATQCQQSDKSSGIGYWDYQYNYWHKGPQIAYPNWNSPRTFLYANVFAGLGGACNQEINNAFEPYYYMTPDGRYTNSPPAQYYYYENNNFKTAVDALKSVVSRIFTTNNRENCIAAAEGRYGVLNKRVFGFIPTIYNGYACLDCYQNNQHISTYCN